MPVLSTWTPEDGVLGAIAPLALACAVDTALVVDLDPAGRTHGGRSLAELVAAGPRQADLVPQRRGTAFVPNGGIELDDARDVLEALMSGWPHVVLRLPPAPAPGAGGGVVPVLTLSPLSRPPGGPAVYQRSIWRMEAPGPGVVLPRPAATTIRALVSSVAPGPSRWVRAWRRVWETPWT
jgi:hypothetical protein